MKIRIAIAALILSSAPAFAQFSAFKATFQWCGSGSPVFKFTGLPKGAVKVDMRMLDLQTPAYDHGGGVAAIAGQGLACGALGFSSYRGPSPPSPHTYRWTIKALDASGAVMAQTTAERRFPE